MRAAKDLLDELNLIDEGLHLEAKTASELGRAILESICAFANKEGGYIVCGVKRSKDQLFGYQTQGIKAPDKFICDIQSAAQTTFQTPVTVNSNREVIGDHCVIVIEVRPVHRRVGLVYFTKDGLPKGAFERRGATDYQFKSHDMPGLIARLARHEDDLLDSESMDSFDPAQVRSYRAMRASVRGEVDEDVPEREFLQMLNFAAERDGISRPTKSGIAFLGTAQARRKIVPGSKVYVARIPQRERCESPGQDVLHQNYDFEGGAFEYTEAAINYVIGALPSSSHFNSESNARDDLQQLRRRIGRELIVNAVAHRDYSALSSVEILHYSNRIEVRNPGTSKIPIERLGTGASDARNAAIAAAFRDINWAESRGTGVATLRRKMGDLGLTDPVFDNDLACGRFTATLILTPMPSEFRNVLPVSFADEEIQVLFACIEIGSLTVPMIQSLLRTTEDLASRTVAKQLLPHGMLSIVKTSNGTEFVPGPCTLPLIRWMSQGALPNTAPTRTSRQLYRVFRELAEVSVAVIGLCRDNHGRLSTIADAVKVAPEVLRAEFMERLLDAGLVRPAMGGLSEMCYMATEDGIRFVELVG